MYWEQIAFCFFAGGFLMMSIIKTFYRHKKNTISERKLDQKFGDEAIKIRNFICFKCEDYKVKIFKMILNYNASFNNSIIIVGSLSESYFFGVRLIGNALAVAIGYIIAFYFVIPFLINLEEDIKSPYQYFERRYGNKKYVRAITAIVGIVFYFSFLTLYLYGCSNLLSQIIPEIPLYVSSILIGIYSIIGSTIGGFTQTTKTNVFQFLIVISGLISASFITINKLTKSMSLKDVYYFAYTSKRTQFFNTNIDLTTRYTILNQLISVIIPWTCFHSLLLPNFMRFRFIKGSSFKKRLMAISSLPSMLIINILAITGGGLLCFFYFYGCDPFTSNRIANVNQTGTFWLYMIFTDKFPAFTGIFFASMVCFSIVQHSMGMTLCGNTIYTDILNPLFFCKFELTEHAIDRIKIVLIVIIGLFSTLYAVSLQFLNSTILSLLFLFNNVFNSPLFGLYLLSTCNPYANHFGAMLAFLTNLAINLWLGLGSLNIFSNIKSQSFPQTTILCSDNNIYSNFTSAYIKVLEGTKYNNKNLLDKDHYPQNEFLYFLYSISSIWYCLFSVLFNLILGSLFSLIYSYLKTKTFDSDSDISENRNKYTYFSSKKNLGT
jgi:SSS family solute:Na+ symporter